MLEFRQNIAGASPEPRWITGTLLEPCWHFAELAGSCWKVAEVLPDLLEICWNLARARTLLEHSWTWLERHITGTWLDPGEL